MIKFYYKLSSDREETIFNEHIDSITLLLSSMCKTYKMEIW